MIFNFLIEMLVIFFDEILNSELSRTGLHNNQVNQRAWISLNLYGCQAVEANTRFLALKCTAGLLSVIVDPSGPELQRQQLNNRD